MPYEVGTDHRILVFGEDKMLLFDNASATQILSAERKRLGEDWVIHVDLPNSSVADVTVKAGPRKSVILAMRDTALKALPGTGYSMTVPHGLEDLP